MNSRRLLTGILTALLCCLTLATQDASAGSRTKAIQVRQTLRLIALKERELERELKGMSATQRARVLATLPTSLDDSDSDGVPDVLEHGNGSNVCSADSDSDGSDDSDEFEHGTEPGDSTEYEVKGTISGLSGSTFTVATKSVSVNDSTKYRHGTSASLVDGACVEVKIDATNPSALVATRVEFKEASECS